jgi:hypothetical protein
VPSVVYPNTARIVCHQSFYGEESVNVYHVHHTEALPLSDAECAELALAFSTLYTGTTAGTAPDRGWKDLRLPTMIFDKVSVYDLTIVPNPPPREFSYNVPGTGAYTKVPLDVAACVTLKTNVGTRRGRGRVFIGPLADAALETSTSGQPSQLTSATAGMTGIRNAFVDLNVRLAAGTLVPTARLGVLSVADAACRLVTAVKTDFYADTQRRRERKAPVDAAVTTSI